MTATTISPQQPEPERVCGDCEFYAKHANYNDRGTCTKLYGLAVPVPESHVCDWFRARKES